MAPRKDLREIADNKNAFYKRLAQQARAEARAQRIAEMTEKVQDEKQEKFTKN